jgi:glycosyltransferase involved in cell wall biosynthesis
MPRITAILHTHNDALRIARAIESLRPCDEVLVVDHGSSDETCKVARRFGARIIKAQGEKAEAGAFVQQAQNDWICCLHPTESLSESLEASVLEWKLEEHPEQSAFGVTTIEETHEGWILRSAETRLAHRKRARWQDWKPQANGVSNLLQGHLMRLRFP